MNQNSKFINISSLKPGDFLLAGVLLLFSCMFMWVTQTGKNHAAQASIIQADTLLQTVILTQDQEIKVDGPYGITIIQIRKGQIFVSEPSCPDKLCKKMGKINRSGQVIVCVPNKILIQIDGNHDHDFDALTQ